MKSLRFILEAALEIEQATDYYEQIGRPLAVRFLSEIESALGMLGRFPDIGTPLDKHLRKHTIRGFPHHLIYSVEPEALIVFALAHHARKPAYWEKRA